jgi:toxin ParE1/3/4
MPAVIKARIVEYDEVNIWKYIANDNEDAASNTLRLLDATYKKLSKSPKIGKQSNDLYKGLRSMPIGPGRNNYVIFYLPMRNGVKIVRVMEGHRNITPDMF